MNGALWSDVHDADNLRELGTHCIVCPDGSTDSYREPDLYGNSVRVSSSFNGSNSGSLWIRFK